MKQRIAVLGAGNMGGALVAGLVAAKRVKPRDVIVADPDKNKLAILRKKWGVKTERNNGVAAHTGTVIVLCIKPLHMTGVLEEISSNLNSNALVISVAAGIQTKTIERALGRIATIRVMPNTPALLREGAMVYAVGRYAAKKHEAIARNILSALGQVWKTTESNMDAVTALSGSGPAYVFFLAECLAKAGADMGLPSALAEGLARQTIHGAGRMLAESQESATELRRRVTSPGGTTEAALHILQKHDLAGLIKKALVSAQKRSKELSGRKTRQ